MGAKNFTWSEMVAMATMSSFGTGSATGDGKRCARARAPSFDASSNVSNHRDSFRDNFSALATDMWASKSRDAPVSTTVLPASEQVPTSPLTEVLDGLASKRLPF